jgi:cytochrome P450
MDDSRFTRTRLTQPGSLTFESHKLARESFIEWSKYMEETPDESVKRLTGLKPNESETLLENLVRAGTPELRLSDVSISPAVVLGNIFVFILAGHKTSANTFAFALTLLACRPQFQRALQADLNKTLGGWAATKLVYPTDHAKLMSGHVGALMKEALRLYSVLPFLPKINKDKPQVLIYKAQGYTLAADTLTMRNLCVKYQR